MSMLWVSEETCVPAGCEPAYIEAKLARLALKPKVPALAMLLLIVSSSVLIALMPERAMLKLMTVPSTKNGSMKRRLVSSAIDAVEAGDEPRRNGAEMRNLQDQAVRGRDAHALQLTENLQRRALL